MTLGRHEGTEARRHEGVERAALCASSSSFRLTPKLLFAASVPAMDWKTRSTGAPASMARIVVVTCESTHDCVGIAYFSIRSAIICTSDVVAATLSVAGLTPIHASPLPYSRPSRMLA